MHILVLGGGGREHALSWKIRQSPLVEQVYIAPGNAGTAKIGENVSLVLSHANVIEFCKKHNIGLVVVGPDDLLAAGIVDALRSADIVVFGPSQAAAEIEWSKAYAKEVMQEAGIPTAKSETFRDFESALAYVNQEGAPIVVKASGLALGKGVTVAMNLEEAEEALRECFIQEKFGTAGTEVVIEEFLTGVEFSAHALCAGTEALLFPSAQDHKRVGAGDTGPNTGGMGTIAPVPTISSEVMEEVRTKVVLPLLETLERRNRSFSGLLFPGIMLTAEGIKVLEFNARFGDPETQSYMRLLESDIVPALLAVAKGSLAGVELSWKSGAAACIVVASGGYPGEYEKGKEIVLPEDAEKLVVFHAGTKRDGEKLLTSGGRVLNVTAIGRTLTEALSKVYEGVSQVSFEGAQYRRDIGAKSLPA